MDEIDSSNESFFTFFLDNHQTLNHRSIIFGLRELTSQEMNNRSSNDSLPITDQPFHFTAPYGLRLFTSGCFYLDDNQQWQSDGLVVRTILSVSLSL